MEDEEREAYLKARSEKINTNDENLMHKQLEEMNALRKKLEGRMIHMKETLAKVEDKAQWANSIRST